MEANFFNIFACIHFRFQASGLLDPQKGSLGLKKLYTSSPNQTPTKVPPRKSVTKGIYETSFDWLGINGALFDWLQDRQSVIKTSNKHSKTPAHILSDKLLR